MFHRMISAALLIAFLGWSVSVAQQKAESPNTKAKDDAKQAAKADPRASEPLFELHLTDDTVMKVVLLDTSVTLTTKYGKLVIPASDIRRLEFGFRYPEGAEAKIEKAIEELGAQDFRTREDAEKRLIKIGVHAIPSLRRSVKSENPEVVQRSREILKQLESKLEEGAPALRDYDVVETTEFTIKGRLQQDLVSVRTKFFGETTVKLTDIRSFRALWLTNKNEFSLEAAKYAKVNQTEWMETTIEISSGQHLEVTASGQVDQWPQGPGQYMTGPEGQANVGRQGGGGIVGVPGQVVGRIGANGTAFPIGASFKAKVSESGKLYLRIGASPWNCPSTGAYKVVVNVVNP